MIRLINPSKDTYITNKIINNSFRATDANTGEAGSLDLFKLYNENFIGLEDNPIEISRLLIKFPIEEINNMHINKEIDLNSNDFKCNLYLHDVYGGQTTPEKFKLILFPLAKSFDEGTGKDVVKFSDSSVCNFITASIQDGSPVEWEIPGALKTGNLGDSNIDIIVSGTLNIDEGQICLSPEQYFEKGTEDLNLDITKIISGTIAGLIPDNGFLIGLSGSYETNNKTYFVKRFASRNVSNPAKRPKLIVKYNDSIIDNHNNFIFNATSSLYLRNYGYSGLENIITDASGTELSGENCMILKIESGSFKKLFNVSQIKNGIHSIDGIYSSSFAISSFEELLYQQINSSGSITFNEIWTNSDETLTYLSSSLKIKKEERSSSNYLNQNNLLVSLINTKKEYRRGEKIKIRVFVEDRNRQLIYAKSPIEKKSEIFQNMHFRIRDVLNGDIIVDFDKINNSTKLSSDDSGMYFDFYTDSLVNGRIYAFDFLIIKNNYDSIIKDNSSNFKIIEMNQ